MDRPHLVDGVVNEQSKYNVAETMDRIESLVWSRGMKVFARIDQQLIAKQSCIDIHASQVLIFGDARIEAPLMKDHPSLALDLPFKVVVWEATPGEVWVSYNSLEYLRDRHSLGNIPFPELDSMILRALC